MKPTTFLLIVMLLLAGCVTKRDRLTPSFYEAKRTDTVWVDYHSIELDSTRTLIVNLKDTADNRNTDTLTPYAMDKPEDNGGCSYRWREHISHQFFNEIITLRAVEALKAMTPAALIESRKETIGRKEVEDISGQINAELVIVLRGVDFNYSHKYDIASDMGLLPPTSERVPSSLGMLQPSSGFGPGLPSSFSITSFSIIYYRSVWDLYWLDEGRVTDQRTIVQQSAYWIDKLDGGPLESTLSCALKVSDDFINLFKQKENRKRE